jgi:hypothetical protein
MKAQFYQALQDDFILVRHLQHPETFDRDLLDTTLQSIREARKKIKTK